MQVDDVGKANVYFCNDRYRRDGRGLFIMMMIVALVDYGHYRYIY